MNAARRRYEQVMITYRTALVVLAETVAACEGDVPEPVRAASERVSVAREALEEVAA